MPSLCTVTTTFSALAFGAGVVVVVLVVVVVVVVLVLELLVWFALTTTTLVGGGVVVASLLEFRFIEAGTMLRACSRPSLMPPSAAAAASAAASAATTWVLWVVLELETGWLVVVDDAEAVDCLLSTTTILSWPDDADDDDGDGEASTRRQLVDWATIRAMASICSQLSCSRCLARFWVAILRLKFEQTATNDCTICDWRRIVRACDCKKEGNQYSSIIGGRRLIRGRLDSHQPVSAKLRRSYSGTG